jgi:hypothetical protein
MRFTLPAFLLLFYPPELLPSDQTSRLEVKELTKKSSFNVFATSPGSFQIELASSIFEPNIFGDSPAGDAIQNLFTLIKIGCSANELQSFIMKSHKQTATKYRLFLEAVINSGSGLKIEWGSPSIKRGGSIKANISSISDIVDLIKKIDSLETREYNVVGKLFMADTDNWKFGIRDITEVSYKGDIMIEAQNDAGTATLGKFYTATILDTPKVNPTTNETKSHYKLVKLTPYESSKKQLELISI